MDGGPSLVRVRDGRGRPLGVATWARAARGSRCASSRAPASPSPSTWWRWSTERLAAALARRQRWPSTATRYRVAHAESDCLPGLIVDRYGDAAVIQTTSVAMSAARDGDRGASCARARRADRRLRATTAPRATSRGCRASRAWSRATARRAWSTGWAATVSRPTSSRDGKTGGFLDQADNHARVAALAPRGRARARRVQLSRRLRAGAGARRRRRCWRSTRTAPAVERARARTPRATGSPTCASSAANAFDLLRASRAQRRALRRRRARSAGAGQARRRAGLAAAARAYKSSAARRAADRAGRPAGRLLLLGARDARALGRASAPTRSPTRAGARTARSRAGAGRDHPELLGVPETGAPQGVDVPNVCSVGASYQQPQRRRTPVQAGRKNAISGRSPDARRSRA